MPSDKAQYVHRLGRTARAGKAGGGFLLLNDFESFFLSQLSDLPVKQRPPLAPAAAAPLAQRLTGAFGRLSDVTLGCGYQAWLGFYNSHLRKLRWSQEELVARANGFALECLGLREPPPLEAKTVGKMGLKGVPGLNIYGRGGIAPKEDRGGGRQGGGGGGGRGGGGGGGGRW